MIVTPEIEAYLDDLEPMAEPVQREMEGLAAQRHFPIVGPQVGRLLALLAHSCKARRVLELGSGFGYSALWFARVLPEDGEVHLTDTDSVQLELAREFLFRAGQGSKARFHKGDALSLAFDGPFDIVFNDVEKEQYPAVIDLVLPLLRPGGLLITDNALWYGKVADPAFSDKATKCIRQYNRSAREHPRLLTVILPLRDGLCVSLLKGP